jgi:hypothetical protein
VDKSFKDTTIVMHGVLKGYVQGVRGCTITTFYLYVFGFDVCLYKKNKKTMWFILQ